MTTAAYRVNIVTIDSTKSVGDGTAMVQGVRGIRAARNVLGDRLGSTLVRSKEAYEAALERLPYMIGSHDSKDVALEAAQAAENESGGVLGCEVEFEAPAPQEAAGNAGAIRIYKVFVDPSGEQSPDGLAREGDTEKDAVLVDDIAGGIESDNPFSWEACASALVSLATANGNPSLANTYAGSYRRVSDDEEFWTEVQDVLEAVFPRQDPE